LELFEVNSFNPHVPGHEYLANSNSRDALSWVHLARLDTRSIGSRKTLAKFRERALAKAIGGSCQTKSFGKCSVRSSRFVGGGEINRCCSRSIFNEGHKGHNVNNAKSWMHSVMFGEVDPLKRCFAQATSVFCHLIVIAKQRKHGAVVAGVAVSVNEGIAHHAVKQTKN
jgi:hypothetical protein